MTILPTMDYTLRDDAQALNAPAWTAPTMTRVRRKIDVRTDPPAMRWAVIGTTVLFLGLFIVLPLINVFAQAFSKGVEVYLAALTDSETLAAVRLTLIVAAVTVLSSMPMA